MNAAYAAGGKNLYACHCGNNHGGSNGGCAVHALCGKYGKVAAGSFCYRHTLFAEILNFVGGKTNLHFAPDNGNGCGNRPFGTDNILNVACGFHILRVRHSVADDGGFKGDNGAPLFKCGAYLRRYIKVKTFIHIKFPPLSKLIHI